MSVQVQHVNVKIFAEGPDVDLAGAIPVFHRWIQESVFEELLIDVADYRHVPAGPGVLLVGHEANYSLDLSSCRLGLLYNRKRLAHGGNAERLRHGLACCLAACAALEDEPALRARGLSFDGSRLRFIINDRLAAPNDDRTLDAVRPDLTPLLGRLWPGAPPSIAREPGDGRRRFTVDARTDSAPPVATLLERLAV